MLACALGIHAENNIIILLCGQKGGVGKSTLATNVAAALSHRSSVVLLDADTQRSCQRWATIRKDSDLSTVDCVHRTGDIRQAIKSLADQYDHVVIDVAGRDSETFRYALTVVDLALCPFIPSSMDINTAPHVAKVIREARRGNPDLDVFAVLSMCSTHPQDRRTEEAERCFDNIEGLPILESRIYQRMAYQDCASTGEGVVEADDPKAASEMHQLLAAAGIQEIAHAA